MNNPAADTTAPAPPPPPPPPPLAVAEVAARLESILAPLLLVVVAHSRILGHLTLPLWTRISRARQLFARLLARLAAGRAPRPSGARTRRARPAPPPAPDGSGGVAIGASPVPALSRRFAWVVLRIGYQAAGLASQLNHLLQQPGAAEAIAASPGAARSMRPLCRMLGIDLPPALRRPAPPRRPGPPRPKLPPPKPSCPAALPAVPPGTPDRGLPDYVRAAVRAWKRGPQKIA